MSTVVDITDRTNTAAVTLLCTFNESVSTPAGRVEPHGEGFNLIVEGKKPRYFESASGAVEVLRRISKPEKAVA